MRLLHQIRNKFIFPQFKKQYS